MPGKWGVLLFNRAPGKAVTFEPLGLVYFYIMKACFTSISFLTFYISKDTSYV